MTDKINVFVWIVWERKTKTYVAHYTDLDDVPDEYLNDDRNTRK